MGQPVFLVRNLFSRRIYPLHILAATAASGAGEIAGNEFARIGDACRDPFDYWTNETANTEVRGAVTCDRSRSADTCVIDRGHNLAGKQVIGEVADVSDFSSAQVAFDCVLPTVTATGDIDDALGVRTEEGAWIKRFPMRSGKYWRVRIPAMGASLKPQVVNIWLDLAWSPALLDTPIAPDSHEIGGSASVTQSGWEIRSGVWVRRKGRVSMRLMLPLDYSVARDQIQYQFGLNRPMWIIHDEEQADRAVLALPRLGTIEIEQRGRNWFYPRVDFEWTEHSAKEAA
jgi:hypothetical protein